VVIARERPVLAPDNAWRVAGAMAQAGVDLTLKCRASQEACGSAIATGRGYCSRTIDHTNCNWVVTRHTSEHHDFSGKTLEEALAWCLVWLTALELGRGPFLN
jgi:hypothetical protein